MIKIKWIIKRIFGVIFLTLPLPFYWMLDWATDDKITVAGAIKKTWEFYKEMALGIKPKEDGINLK